MDWNKIAPLLEAKLDPKHVKKGGGQWGPKGDYVEGWHAIAEANRIFGHGGWSYTIDLRQDDLREVTTPKGPQWQAAYTCICTLTVGGVVRQDVGFGSGFAKGVGDAIEGATKESATDALKRCLRTFGNPFGLALYDKTRENVGVDEPEPPKAAPAPREEAPAPEALAKWLRGQIGKAQNEAQLDTIQGHQLYKDRLSALAKADAEAAKDVVAEGMRKRVNLADPVVFGEHRLDDPQAFEEAYREGRRA